MNKQIVKIAQDFVSKVKDRGILISGAYLFGSYAKNHPHWGSDIDVCIVSPQFGKDTIDEMVLLAKIAHDLDLRLEPHPMNPEDMAEKYNLFAHEIKTHGIPLT